MQIVKLSKETISVQMKNPFETPKIIQTIRFFDRFNVELYNKIKQIKNSK
jgi:hypothetical protein